MTVSPSIKVQYLNTLILSICSLFVINVGFGQDSANNHHQFNGPLKVHKTNPRYFTDNSGKPIYLTGSHTWNNFQDNSAENPPVLDFEKYLDFIQEHNHNFIRLWVWESIRGSAWNNNNEVMQPMVYQRSDPGLALDNKPLYDLAQFNEDYFTRLYNRVKSAHDRGIYVGIMLFQGFSIAKKSTKARGNPWPGHPFHKLNNINGINGDPNNDGNGYETHTLQIKDITKLQEEYVKKVIETVGNFENIIFEIANESHGQSTNWQYHLIDFIRQIESDREIQHPIWISFQFDVTIGMGTNDNLFQSSAEVISPSHQDNPQKNDYLFNPPINNGSKIIILDTDHLWGIGGDEIWVWKAFTRGLNPIFMDRYLENVSTDQKEINPRWKGIRYGMGQTLKYANKIDLANTFPTDDSLKCSTRYCLMNEGKEYIAFQPDTEEFLMNIKPGNYFVEWINPIDDTQLKHDKIKITQRPQKFKSPWPGPSVLFLYK